MAPPSKQDFINKLRLEKFESEQSKAEESLALLEHIVANASWQTGSELLTLLRNVDIEVSAKLPWETTPRNMVQRALKIVVDEYSSCRGGVSDMNTSGHPSFPQVTMVDPTGGVELPKCDLALPDLRDRVLEALAEYRAELEQSDELIAVQGESKIHNDEVILTFDWCGLVLAFLTRAAKRRHFHVIVAEGAPTYQGHRMAASLSRVGIQTTLIQDCAVFPMMSRVNKVIIGTHTVLSNGGIKTDLGAAALASAAKFYSVPLYVCTPTYKFSRISGEEVNHCGSGSAIIPTNTPLPSSVNVAVSRFDYVPPENVTSFITNNRGIAPSYVYRHLTELYDPAAYHV
ncbi:hypothetical protein Pcinc_043563 [Petrolisthes cinctipes]|uniref:Translation initiation factor eIF2B subunit beta n=1 Tax=Petrolisthes cinctipes TaxID=88211 RepID=A0AAE1BFQ5_PETCI|nr:hypothetical protein Pcinc_043563 [Petrolisthes cinctipes]